MLIVIIFLIICYALSVHFYLQKLYKTNEQILEMIKAINTALIDIKHSLIRQEENK